MAQGLLARETIADFGEFRAYFRADRDELTFEAFREGDGRAWLLRVPLAARSALSALLRDVGPMLPEDTGHAGEARVLRQVSIGPADQLAASRKAISAPSPFGAASTSAAAGAGLST